MVILASLGMILSLIYSLFLYNRIFFGSLQKTFIRFYCDCSRLEFVTLFIFVIFVFVLGLYPGLSIFNFISSSLIFEVINY
jgi:NADH:ubiquinone oxidoreductase subunit 4 (subunit M)